MRSNRRKRLPVALSQQEVDALIGQVNPKCTTGLRNRAMLAAMLGAGLRVSELVKLRPSDVDLAAGQIRVNMGKGGVDRVVPVADDTTAWFRAWQEKRRALGCKRGEPFFTTVRARGKYHLIGTDKTCDAKGCQGLHVRYVQMLIKRLGKKAGIEKAVTPHVLRHTCATRWLQGGLDIREVQQLLGHASVTTTQIYTHVDPAAIRAKVQGHSAADAAAATLAAIRKVLAGQKPTAGERDALQQWLDAAGEQ